MAAEDPREEKQRQAAEPLAEAVERRRAQERRWRREGERSIARNLAMIGVVGWLVVLPALAGVFVGRALDGPGEVFWTLSLMSLGLALGCWLGWQRITRER